MRFLLIDRIITLEPGISIHAECTLDPSLELFKDHFPGFEVVPGVLLTEMLAQAAGKCLDAQRLPRGKAMMCEIRSARFHSWIRPGETASIFVQVNRNGSDVATVKGELRKSSERVCTCELMFAFKPFDTFSPEYRDELLETFLSASNAPEVP